MKIALVGCSNGQKITYKERIDELINILNSIGVTLVKRSVGGKLPIAKTRNIGHGTDSKGIAIGKYARYSSR